MNFRKLFVDDDAVSPVIGVILMVAITVILAAVIGTFVLGLGDQVKSQSPQVSFEFETNNVGDGTATNDEWKVTHGGGDSIDPANLKITLGGDTHYDDGSTQGVTGIAYTDNLGTTVSAGSSLTIAESATDVYNSEVTFRVIWENPDSDKSSVIGSQEMSAD